VLNVRDINLLIVAKEEGFDWPFVLRRHQFPVRVAYAMIINKNQGQNVGIYLPSSVFYHGQLYVVIVATLALACDQGKGVARLRAYK
jgi:hypothetical protein